MVLVVALEPGSARAHGNDMLHPLILLATPIFGLSLQVDPTVALPSPVVAQIEAQLDAAAAADENAEPEQTPESPESATPSPTDPSAESVAATTSADVSPTAAAEAGEATPRNEVADALARRARIARVHRAMGITTWGTMTLAVVLGTIQYYNLYGWFAGQGSTPCVRGTQVGSYESCLGTPTLHAVSAGLASASYATTFALSYAMPDPIGLDRGNSESARRLRRHKRLRWAHFSGMIAQVLLGVVVANDRAFGIDRANHFRAAQALSTVHMVTGYTTYALLTWSGAIMMRR